MSDARPYVQNPQWATEPRSIPEVTQMMSYQALYQHQMTTLFEQQTSQVSGPVKSTANQFASCCLPSKSVRGDILATENSYGSPRISFQIYGNSAVVESLHPTLDSQRNACDSLPLPADNLIFMPGQRTMCLPGRSIMTACSCRDWSFPSLPETRMFIVVFRFDSDSQMIRNLFLILLNRNTRAKFLCSTALYGK